MESQQQGNKGGYYKPFVLKTTKMNVPTTNTVTTNSVPKPMESKLPVFKRLSPAERKERASKGLCFNYDDKFSPGHKCKGRIFKLLGDETTFWEVEHECDQGDTVEEVQIEDDTADPIPSG